ncbi:MAG TPA: hypothetical protein VG796_20145 [Verrucomicrobiales bacterium]|nr:hypothetical protein [Verrucomicrobiales bacterium]
MKKSLSITCLSLSIAAARAQSTSSDWNTGTGAWDTASNWLPAGVPGNGGDITYDVRIGNLPLATDALVTLVPKSGTSATINSLSISSRAGLLTNGRQLIVAGQTLVGGGGDESRLQVDPHMTAGTVAFSGNEIVAGRGGAIEMKGGLLNADALLEIRDGARLSGYGIVTAGDSDNNLEDALLNEGLIEVTGDTAAPRTLTLRSTGLDGIRLSGMSSLGSIAASNFEDNVNADTLRLLVEGRLSVPFNARMDISQRDTVTFTQDYALDEAFISMDGGSAVATLDGNGKAISIKDSEFNIRNRALIASSMKFTGVNNSIIMHPGAGLTLNGAVDIPDASLFSPVAGGNSLNIGGAAIIHEVSGDFNWDRLATTVQGNGSLTLDVNHLNPGNNVFRGDLILAGEADLNVNVSGDSWEMAGTLTKTGVGDSLISGDTMILSGTVNESGGIELPRTRIVGGNSLTTATKLALGDGSIFEAPSRISGPGLLYLLGSTTFAADTTIDTRDFYWNGWAVSNIRHEIKDGVAVTINSPDFPQNFNFPVSLTLGGEGAKLIVNNSRPWEVTSYFSINPGAKGTATIGGTSKMNLHSFVAGPGGSLSVGGNANLDCPVRLAATVNIAAAGTLNVNGAAEYFYARILGQGQFYPSPSSNIVSGFPDDYYGMLIETPQCNLNRGNWSVTGTLEVNSEDCFYGQETDVFIKDFRLDRGRVIIHSAVPAFIMDGTLEMFSSGLRDTLSSWSGIPLRIGNDNGNRDAHLRIGYGGAQIDSDISFESDADVELNGSLTLNGAVDFNSVKSTVNARYSGNYGLSCTGGVSVNESTVLNGPGQFVSLDHGSSPDFKGNLVSIHAPLVIQGGLAPFGDLSDCTLDIDHLGPNRAGTLTVAGAAVSGPWFLGKRGILNLKNGNSPVTLLTGSGIDLSGTLNVTGDVRSDAKFRFGAESYTKLLTANSALRLNGGDNTSDTNTITGAFIDGPGVLRADSGRSLRGSGLINAGINFEGTADLLAKDGILTLEGPILRADRIGTFDGTGSLNIPGPWDTAGISVIELNGGDLRGGPISINNPGGLKGHGTIFARVINNSVIEATSGTLVIRSTFGDNNLNGIQRGGSLAVSGGATMEIHDSRSDAFNNSLSATGGSTVALNGFPTHFDAEVLLQASTLRSDRNIGFRSLSVAAGEDSIVAVTSPPARISFDGGTAHTLNTSLLLDGDSVIGPYINFGGTGWIIVPENRTLNFSSAPLPDSASEIRIENRGIFRPSGYARGTKFRQSATGRTSVKLAGIDPGEFDHAGFEETAEIHGSLTLELAGGYMPVAGQTFDILTAKKGVTGTFQNVIQPPDIPLSVAFSAGYTPGVVRLTVIPVASYNRWIESFSPLTNPADREKSADPDHDGLVNLGEFALNGDPARSGPGGRIRGKISRVSGSPAFTYTIPVRAGAVIDPEDPPGGPLLLKQPADALRYSLQASTDLADWSIAVSEVTGPDAALARIALPPLDQGWEYRTFRANGPAEGRRWMRVVVTE